MIMPIDSPAENVSRPAPPTLPGLPSSDSRPDRVLRLSLDVVVPVYNEETDLAPAVRRLHRYLSSTVPYSFRITIANNASVDGTAKIADDLAREFEEVRVLHLDLKGRGLALKAAWSGSDAEVLVYTDVDLSADLAALLPLVAPLLTGHSDLAIGSRLARGSRVVRARSGRSSPAATT